MIVQLISQLFFKGGMSYIIELFFTLQMIVYIHYYSFYKPAIAEAFIYNFITILEFRMLRPEPFVQIWIEDFTFKKFINDSK